MKKKGKLKRDQHISFVVEPKMREKLENEADKRFTTISSLCYGIIKEWLAKQRMINNFSSKAK